MQEVGALSNAIFASNLAITKELILDLQLEVIKISSCIDIHIYHLWQHMHKSYVVASLKTYHNMYHNYHVKTIHRLLKLVFIIMVKSYLFRMTPQQLKIEKSIKIIKNVYWQANVSSNHSQFLGRCIVSRLAIVVSEPIKFKHIRINNDIVRSKLQWYTDHALRLATTTFIKDLCSFELNISLWINYWPIYGIVGLI